MKPTEPWHKEGKLLIICHVIPESHHVDPHQLTPPHIDVTSTNSQHPPWPTPPIPNLPGCHSSIECHQTHRFHDQPLACDVRCNQPRRYTPPHHHPHQWGPPEWWDRQEGPRPVFVSILAWWGGYASLFCHPHFDAVRRVDTSLFYLCFNFNAVKRVYPSLSCC